MAVPSSIEFIGQAADIPKATAGFLLGGAIFTQGIAYFDDQRLNANTSSSHSWHCLHVLAR